MQRSSFLSKFNNNLAFATPCHRFVRDGDFVLSEALLCQERLQLIPISKCRRIVENLSMMCTTETRK
jgi:hypothetical protein